jgi:peptidoglycan/xylan/chitin deacetylase (PgdA/CDA1 family)
MAPKGARRLRNTVKSAVASTIAKAYERGLSRSFRRGGYRPLVLGYHRIVEDYHAEAQVEMPSMLTSRAMFERHLDCLATSFTFVSLDEIADRLRYGLPFERPVAAITFDDGYQDVYELALPVLERKGIPAAMFVVTDLVSQPSSWQIHDKLYHLVAKAFACWDDPRQQMLGLLTDLGLPARDLTRRAAIADPMIAVSTLLPGLPQADIQRVMAGLESSVGNGFHNVPQTVTWDMVNDMRRRGFTIGSHTRSHVSLPTESAETIAAELTESKRELENRLGESIDHFAYPGGHFTDTVVEAVALAGYKYAYTACPHDVAEHRLLTIERLLLWEGSSVNGDGDFIPGILSCQAHALWPPARRCERVHHA